MHITVLERGDLQTSNGDELILTSKEAIVQQLSSEPKPTAKKLIREGTREYLSFSYEEKYTNYPYT